MNLLVITSDTWLVTGLGFGLVLVLLCVFVWLMQLMGWIMQPREKAPQEPAQNTSATSGKPEEKEAIGNNGDTTAAIAMALHLYYNSLHDEEPTQVTVHPHKTQWNSKVFGLNQ